MTYHRRHSVTSLHRSATHIRSLTILLSFTQTPPKSLFHHTNQNFLALGKNDFSAHINLAPPPDSVCQPHNARTIPHTMNTKGPTVIPLWGTKKATPTTKAALFHLKYKDCDWMRKRPCVGHPRSTMFRKKYQDPHLGVHASDTLL